MSRHRRRKKRQLNLFPQPRRSGRSEPKRRRFPHPPKPGSSAIDRARWSGFQAGREGRSYMRPGEVYQTSEEYLAWYAAWQLGQTCRIRSAEEL